jgi:hypothetical protein
VVSITPWLLYPRERASGTHWIGGWVGPRDILDVVVKRKIPAPAGNKLYPIAIFSSLDLSPICRTQMSSEYIIFISFFNFAKLLSYICRSQ